MLASGFVLWAPVLTELPGAPRLSALGRGGYLIVQSIVPSFLSIVWIFARHSLYPTFTHAGTVVGMSPLLDQQLAGFLAKLSTIAVLWTVAFVIMTRAQSAEDTGQDAEPLMWSDVEREIERAERRQRRQRWPGSIRHGVTPDRGAAAAVRCTMVPMGITVIFRVRGQADATGRATTPSRSELPPA